MAVSSLLALFLCSAFCRTWAPGKPAGSVSPSVLVVAAQPEDLLAFFVAAHGGAVQQAVVAHRRLEPAGRRDVRPVDGALGLDVRAQPRPLGDVVGDVGAARPGVLLDGRWQTALEERPQLLLGVQEAKVAVELTALGRGP